jgi:myosin protein heavy chain
LSIVGEELSKVDSLVDHHAYERERVVVDLDDDDGSTLVGGEVGEKEVDVDVTDDELESGDGGEGCGVKRKRTIRVVIRSRAFL